MKLDNIRIFKLNLIYFKNLNYLIYLIFKLYFHNDGNIKSSTLSLKMNM